MFTGYGSGNLFACLKLENFWTLSILSCEVNTRMTGKLQDSGINQTIYTISFDVNIRAAVVFPFRYREIPIKIENVISETVIIGAVPESYTYFNMEGEMTPEEMQGYVEDFKAE